MAEANQPVSNSQEVPEAQPATMLGGDETAIKLVAEILAGQIVDIKPQLDFTTDLGFTYPAARKVLKVSGEEVVSILESLTDKGILRRDFFDRLLRCPRCQSLNLRPSTYCPKCGSANIVRGRILEHSACKYVGTEDDFVSKGKYVCPECKVELHTIGTDYQSLGLLRKCRDCYEIFSQPEIQWRCLKCGTLTPQDKVSEVNIYSYRFDETKRNWLEFELKPKSQLIEFLKHHGYRVSENATMKGRSGAEHNIDILATRDDGVVTHDIAIGVEVAGDKIGLEKIFGFDDKAYDIGIHDKILIVIPGLGREAETFASQQRIKVLEVRDLETVLASGAPGLGEEIYKEPFEFKSKSQLIQYLERHAYEVKENTVVKGRSGAKHSIDILATRDDGIVTHHIAFGIEVSEQPIEVDKVFDFDDKAYDIGIQDKALIAVPGLSREASQFAQRQRIKVFEVNELEPSG